MSGTGKPSRDFKKGESAEDNRHKREQTAFQLRKNTREEQVARRRRVTEVVAASSAEDKAPAPSAKEQLSQLPYLVQALASDNYDAQFDATIKFRKLLSIEQNPPIQEIIDTGVVPRFIQFLSYAHYPKLQFEAAWALTNIASGTTKHTQAVIGEGAIPIFVHLLRSESDDVKEQAVWALGNIAGDSYKYRDLVLESGALQPLLEMCNSRVGHGMLRNATWTLSNLCRGKPQPDFKLVRPCLETLANLLTMSDDEVLTDACWALSYLTDDDTEPENIKIEAVLRSGVAPRLVALLRHVSNAVRTPALRTVGNIVTGNDKQTEAIVNCGVLQHLFALLTNSKKTIRKESCWAISNITAGDANQIQQVIHANLFPQLVEVIKTQDFDISKEAVWAICNATNGGNADQIRYISSNQVGAVPALCSLLAYEDVKIVQVAMEGIENMLKVAQADAKQVGGENVVAAIVEDCGGLDDLEKLQEAESVAIYEKAQSLITNFFGVEDEADTNAAPAVNAATNTFSFGSSSNTQTDYNL